ncbi:MAG TPA: MBL fold metallo-hydrolase [Acidimicrobiales bacterium]
MGLSVTVLGSSGSYAGPGEACSGYLLRSPGATVVVDLGSGTLANLQRHVALADLDAVVLTHDHPDHWLDLPLLRNAMRYFLGLEGLAVHATAGTLEAARGLQSELEPTFACSRLREGSTVVLGDLALRFGRTDHPVETLAVRAETGGRTLLYSADTGPDWDPGGLGADVDLFLCEATLPVSEEGRVQHLSGRQAGELAQRIGAARLVITHVGPGVDAARQRDDASATFPGPVEVAHTGAHLEV